MTFTIRKTRRENVASIIQLLRDFARFEGFEEYCTITEEILADTLFGEGAFVESLVALDGDRMIAYAFFYPCFASFRGQKGLFLEDLYIDADYRRKGLGEAMLKEIAGIAKSRNFERIDFQVLEWNTPAIKFYKKHGAVCNEEERHYNFTDDAFHTLAK
jgi:hypothetical protein